MTKQYSMIRRPRPFGGLMSDPFDAFFDIPVNNHLKPAPLSNMMRTDIKESDGGFSLAIDLPGFAKEDIQVELKDGFLAVQASTKSETEESDEGGTYVRKERFSGTCSRRFYVGEEIEEDEIKAKFENGVLTIEVPKKHEEPKLEEGRSISIEG